MAQFITKKNNKFENKTTTEGMPCLMEKQGHTRWYFDLRQISTPKGDDLVIDIQHFSPDWFFLKNGNLIINLDGKKNIAIDAHESYSDVGQEQGAFEQDSTVVTEENCFYELTKEQLKEICDASHVDIQVTGDSEKKQMDGTLFRLYARAYYNSFFDNSLYKGALSSFQEKYSKWKRIEWWQKNWAWICVPLAIGLGFLIVHLIDVLFVWPNKDWTKPDVVWEWWGLLLISGGLIGGTYAYIKTLGDTK